MKLALSTLLPFALTAITALAHSHDLEGEELVAYRRNYLHAQDTLNKRCSASMRRRRALSSFKRSVQAHPPAVQRSMYEAFERDTDSSDTSNNSSACILAPEVTQGPYHILGELVRNNVTETQGGIPLTLTMSFTDVETCEPLKLWVDFWHANATGIYSGYIEASTGSGGSSGGSGGGSPPSGDNSTASGSSSMGGGPGSASQMPSGSASQMPSGSASAASASGTSSSSSSSSEADMFSSLATDEETFLRGVAETDSDGQVTFHTIFPGWYVSRAVHIHLRAYGADDGYMADNGTFVATALSHHTGQVFFDDSIGEQLSTISPYSENSLTWDDATKNDDDTILVQSEAGGWSAVVNVVYVDESDITKGLTGTIEVGVNTTVQSEELSDSYWHGTTTTTSTSVETATTSGTAANAAGTSSTATASTSTASVRAASTASVGSSSSSSSSTASVGSSSGFKTKTSSKHSSTTSTKQSSKTASKHASKTSSKHSSKTPSKETPKHSNQHASQHSSKSKDHTKHSSKHNDKHNGKHSAQSANHGH